VILCQTASLDESSESGHIVWEEHRVMEQFLVALVAIRLSFSLIPPRADFKYAIPLSSASILGASEESFGDIMMLSCV
jgi:hypothetical protein